jgi:hypothetical protein
MIVEYNYASSNKIVRTKQKAEWNISWNQWLDQSGENNFVSIIQRFGICDDTTVIRIKREIRIFFILWGGTKSLGTAATSGLLYKPQMIDEDDCGAICGMKTGRGNRSTRRKPAPAPLCPPQIPHDQTRARTPGRRGWKPANNRLSYGAALDIRESYIMKSFRLVFLAKHN